MDEASATQGLGSRKSHSASGLACVDAGTCTALTGYTPLFAIFVPSNHPATERSIRQELETLLERFQTPRELLEALVLQPMILDPLEWHPVIRNGVKPSWFTHPMNLYAFRAVCQTRSFYEWRMKIKEDYGAKGLDIMDDVLTGGWDFLCSPDEGMAFTALQEMAERGKRVEEFAGSVHGVRN